MSPELRRTADLIAALLERPTVIRAKKHPSTRALALSAQPRGSSPAPRSEGNLSALG